MKLRILKLTPEQLVALIQGKPTPFSGNLPSDAELFDVKVDLFTNQVSLIVRSDSFEDVAEVVPPELNISPKAETKPALVSKPATTPAAKALEPKPEVSHAVAKSPQPPTSRYAAKMENEFSPDQRKLLSFTVKGDSVVVKPVVFLKTEWDDINDVVRSLGGRWVKGDIISYWEIPLH
jgi:hypothetical protein